MPKLDDIEKVFPVAPGGKFPLRWMNEDGNPAATKINDDIVWLCAKLRDAEKGFDALANNKLIVNFQVGEPMVESEYSLEHFRDVAAKLLKSIRED